MFSDAAFAGNGLLHLDDNFQFVHNVWLLAGERECYFGSSEHLHCAASMDFISGVCAICYNSSCWFNDKSCEFCAKSLEIMKMFLKLTSYINKYLGLQHSQMRHKDYERPERRKNVAKG